jgi:hypothetical protein
MFPADGSTQALPTRSHSGALLSLEPAYVVRKVALPLSSCDRTADASSMCLGNLVSQNPNPFPRATGRPPLSALGERGDVTLWIQLNRHCKTCADFQCSGFCTRHVQRVMLLCGGGGEGEVREWEVPLDSLPYCVCLSGIHLSFAAGSLAWRAH